MKPGRERRLRARDTESDQRGTTCTCIRIVHVCVIYSVVCAGLLVDSDAELGGVQAKFTFVTGVIAREKVPAFERILWRACRGNVFLRQAPIEHPLEDPSTVRCSSCGTTCLLMCPCLCSQGDQVFKVVFILFFQGDQLRTRVRKICEG